jgi:hypothetical protein
MRTHRKMGAAVASAMQGNIDRAQKAAKPEPDPTTVCVECGVRPWGHGYCGEQCKECAHKDAQREDES